MGEDRNCDQCDAKLTPTTVAPVSVMGEDRNHAPQVTLDRINALHPSP